MAMAHCFASFSLRSLQAVTLARSRNHLAQWTNHFLVVTDGHDQSVNLFLAEGVFPYEILNASNQEQSDLSYLVCSGDN